MDIEADKRTSSGGESGGDGGGGGVSSDDDAQTTPLLHEVDLFVEPDLISAGGRNSYDASSSLHRLFSDFRVGRSLRQPGQLKSSFATYKPARNQAQQGLSSKNPNSPVVLGDRGFEQWKLRNEHRGRHFRTY
jgi:hypothetical protein